MTCFVTAAWAWKNRPAARKFLRENNKGNSIDMAFLQLRGSLVDVLHKGSWKAANQLLIDFQSTTDISKTQLKKALKVIGTCITTGTEDFDQLRAKLRSNKKLRANLKDVRKHTSLCTLLVAV